MPTPTAIKAIEYRPLNVPLIEPFKIAIGTLETVRNVLIILHLENGVTGYGEAAPLEPINGENQATILATLASCADWLTGRDVMQWRQISADLYGVFSAQAAARAGLEMAILDAAAKTMNVPLYQFFGGASSSVETDISIPIVTAARAQELAADIQARDVKTIKIKVGSGIEDDTARVLAVREGGPHLKITLDANQGYNATGAVELLRRLAAHDIEIKLFEQPVHKHDLAGMRYVTEHGGVPVAADETVFNAHDALMIAQTGAANVVNIKLMKSGLVEAMDIAAVCRANHIGLMIGGMIETRLGMCCSAHFAAGLGGFDFVDLDTPMLLADDPFEGGWQQMGGTYDLSQSGAGIGVSPKSFEL